MKKTLFIFLVIKCTCLSAQVKSNSPLVFSDFECNAPEVTLYKCNADWLPKGGDEANTITITASTNNPNVKGVFFFHLFEVSSEIGYSMNAPSVETPIVAGGLNSNTWKDLQFLNQPGFSPPKVVGTYSFVRTIGPDVSQATVTVKSYDYGARGKIRVLFQATGSIEMVPGKEEGSNNAYTTIPLDVDENGIADNAPLNLNNGSKVTDNDNVPAGNNTGDGLTRFEEYRGFMVTSNGISSHKRLSAEKKDVFLFDNINEVQEGGSFNSINLTADVHNVTEQQFSDPAGRVINFRVNADNDYLHTDQRIIGVVGAYDIPTDWDGIDFWGRAPFVNSDGSMIDPSLWSPNTVLGFANVAIDLIKHGLTLKNEVNPGDTKIFVNECPYAGAGFDFCTQYIDNGSSRINNEVFQYEGFVNFEGKLFNINSGAGINGHHDIGSKVAYFSFENEVIDGVFTHEAGHIVGLVHEICNQNIMCTPLAVGSTLNNGYYLSIIGNNPNALQNLRIK